MKTAYTKYPVFSDRVDLLKEIGFQTESVKFDGRMGKWYLINYCSVYADYIEEVNGWTRKDSSLIFLGLFEHETYGDLADHVLAFYDTISGENVWREIDGTYDDLYIALIDNDIVEG